MKKRLLCTILIMVMMFGATVPSYADAWAPGDVTYIRQGIGSLVSLVTNIYALLQTNYGSSGDLALMGENIAKLVSWFAPEGYKPSDYHSLWEICLDMGTALYQYLPHIPTIAGYVGSWMSSNTSLLTTNNSHLNELRLGITSYYPGKHKDFTIQDAYRIAHSQMFGRTYGGEAGDVTTLRYFMPSVLPNGQIGGVGSYWTNGSPIGNIAQMLQLHMQNQTRAYSYTWQNALTDYTGQLGIWDSQGETLTQEGWSPTSAINGLYKYLAYTQRDVARLTYVLASDEEIETREKARQNQEAVLDNFVDHQGSGSVSASNFGDIASASDSFKDNMNTGVSASGIFDVFNGDHTSAWFSTETANELNNVGSGRRSLKASSPQPTYDTPLLDAKMKELLGIFGGDGE